MSIHVAVGLVPAIRFDQFCFGLYQLQNCVFIYSRLHLLCVCHTNVCIDVIEDALSNVVLCMLSMAVPSSLTGCDCCILCRGKVKRAVGQFTPYYWTSFQWGYTQSFTRFIFVFVLAIIVSLPIGE